MVSTSTPIVLSVRPVCDFLRLRVLGCNVNVGVATPLLLEHVPRYWRRLERFTVMGGI